MTNLRNFTAPILNAAAALALSLALISGTVTVPTDSAAKLAGAPASTVYSA